MLQCFMAARKSWCFVNLDLNFQDPGDELELHKTEGGSVMEKTGPHDAMSPAI